MTQGPARELSWRVFWRWNALVWAAFALISFTVRFLLHGDAGRALGLTLIQEPLAFLISGIIWAFYQRPRISDPFRVSTAAWVIALSLAAAVLQSAITRSVSERAGWTYEGWTAREEWLFRVTFVWLFYLAWSLAIFALRSRHLAEEEHARAERATLEAQRLELRLLRAQLDPHFLFNALNAIAALIPTRPDAATAMIHELCDYFRYSLGSRNALLAPLSAELNAVAAYLKIEQARFGERMSVVVESDAAARAKLVPSFLLQPLVENAVKHGLEADRCEIRVAASCRDEVLKISVSNPGQLPPDLLVFEGVGLETLRRRIELHYPGRAAFELSQMDGVVTAEVQLRGEPCSG